MVESKRTRTRLLQPFQRRDAKRQALQRIGRRVSDGLNLKQEYRRSCVHAVR
jgi:hypothetical protein